MLKIECLQNTMKSLIDKFDCDATENSFEIMNFKCEMAQWVGITMDEVGYLSLSNWLEKQADNNTNTKL